MNPSPVDEELSQWQLSKPSPFNRVIASLEVLLVAVGGFVLIPVLIALTGFRSESFPESALQLFLFLAGESIVTLGIIVLFLKWRGESFRTLSTWPGRPRLELTIGMLALPVLFASTFVVGILFQYWLPAYVSRENPILQLVDTPWDLMLLLLSSIFVGGVKEELQRAFVLIRFEKYLGGMVLGLFLWSAFFAVGHTIQGVDKAVAAGVLGFIFGLLYLWRRNLAAPILAHALYDIVTLLAYWTFYRS
jgi:membrane protease YdiL (CAAX protease family)